MVRPSSVGALTVQPHKAWEKDGVQGYWIDMSRVIRSKSPMTWYYMCGQSRRRNNFKVLLKKKKRFM